MSQIDPLEPGWGASGDTLLLSETPGGVRVRASLLVASRAGGVEDCRILLDALGLLPVRTAGDVVECPGHTSGA